MPYTYDHISRLRKEASESKEKYWEKVAEKLVWTKKWTSVFEESENPFGTWFSGAQFSMCYNCLDRHVNEGRGEKNLYIFDSPITQTYRTYTYSDVLDQVSRLAGVLTSLGVTKGDAVMIIMPSIPEAAFAFLACSRIGACHAGITGGLTPPDILQRIEHCKPKVILMASHGYHASGWMNYKAEVDSACETASSKPKYILLYQREEQPAVSMVSGRDLDWKTQMAKACGVGCTSAGVSDPLIYSYTSGSTGSPKAVVHAGGLCALRWIHDLEHLLGDRNELLLAPVNFGWIAAVIMVAYGIPLLGSTVVIFEGDCLFSEDPEYMYRSIERSKATRMFVRPGIWKIIRGMDPEGAVPKKYDLSSLNHIVTVGERTDNATTEWVSKTLHSNVWNCYGQTETGGLISGAIYKDETNEVKGYDYMLTLPGHELKIVYVDDDDKQQEAKPFEMGTVLLKAGSSPLSFITLLHDHEAYLKKYFSEYPGHLNMMDQGCMDERGHLRVEGRTDDMMKVGLHYVTSPAIEEVVMDHNAISECVVVSSTDLVWKEIPVTIFTRKPENSQSVEEIEKEVHDAVHGVLGSTLKLGHLVEVKEIPITRTGKLHRPSCRAMVRGQDLKGLGAVENPEVLPAVRAALLQAGYAKDILHD